MILKEWDLSMNLKNSNLILLTIFLLALALRLFYFPQNTYFGFDQARDAYAVKEIIDGHLKITGPPTASQIFNHGVLYYYIFTPFYYLSAGDPAAVSLFLRILNACGIFLVFLIAYPMFGRTVALLAAFLFAISYEQTQFSLFLNHPSLVVLSVLIFYLGLSVWIFRKENWGLLLALFGLGLSIQFEFVEIQLIAIFILFVLLFRKELPRLKLKKLLLGLLVLFLPLSTYFISEIKNNFLNLRQAPILFNHANSFSPSNFSQFLLIINRHFHDNFVANPLIASILATGFLIIFSKLIHKGIAKSKLIFLAVWFFGGLLVYFIITNDAYFYNTGTSISLLIFAGFIISKIHIRNQKIATILLLILIFFSNIYLITKNNPSGPNQKINPQAGLLLEDEKKVLDFIYQDAKGESFAVNALTMPYNINTTWSYLFEWYGMRRYGYVPVWGGDVAEGFPGTLKVESARSQLPQKRFLIIEPQEGIPAYLKDSFLSQEENYNTTLEKRKIGTIEVWVQEAK